MAQYKAKIKNQESSFFALVIRIDVDGQESVASDYKGRFFNTLKAAEKSTQKYINEAN